jgi:formamidopyrimidine-DNA glycosylase
VPELPEVEHVRRKLRRWLVGARIVAAEAGDRLVFQGDARSLRGRTVERVDRRGKWLRLALDDGRKIFSHLGMTGDYRLGGSDRFERVRLEVERRGKRSVVRYVDPRRWGRIVVATDDIRTWSRLGPDPLHDGIDVARLSEKLARRKRRSVKEALMDQTVLAGIGNIQAIEALWKAKVDPRSKAAAVGPAEVRAIARGLRWTIGRTLADLARLDQGAENPFKIYGRRGTPCPRCGGTLERYELGGRTTTSCPGCQQRLRLLTRARGSHGAEAARARAPAARRGRGTSPRASMET